MVKGFRFLYDETQKCTKDKLKCAVLGQVQGRELLYSVIAYGLYCFLTIKYIKLFSLFLILFLIFVYVMYATRYATVGLAKDRIIIVRFSRIRKEIMKIYDIPIDNVRYFDFKKGLFKYSLRLSFFDRDGNFVKFKYKFGKNLMASGAQEYKKNVEVLSKEFMKIQKTLDKGDF